MSTIHITKSRGYYWLVTSDCYILKRCATSWGARLAARRYRKARP